MPLSVCRDHLDQRVRPGRLCPLCVAEREQPRQHRQGTGWTEPSHRSGPAEIRDGRG